MCYLYNKFCVCVSIINRNDKKVNGCIYLYPYGFVLSYSAVCYVQ